MDEDLLVDRIYEAGAVPELWPEMLHRFGAYAGAAGGLIFSAGGDRFNWAASPGVLDLTRAYMENGFVGNDPRTARLIARDHAGFVSDLDVFTLEEWQADRIRREFFVPRGFGWGIATEIKLPTGEIIVIHAERRTADGPFGQDVAARLDRLRPHLARAAMMSTRIAFERVRAAVAALEIVGIPAAVLDARGRLVASNALLDALIPAVVAPRSSRVALANPAADRLLGTAVEALKAAPAAIVPHSVPVPARAGHEPMVAHLHPIRGVARDIFTSASALLLFTTAVRPDLPSMDVIRGLFDLTPAEARIARAIGGGMTVESIAKASATSVATIRNQLRAVFAKTGMHRQADLVGLLRGISAPGEKGDDG